jgi:hypothetical protein
VLIACSVVFALSILFGRGQVAAKPNLNARVESLMWGGTSNWEGSNPPNQLKAPIFTVVSIRNTGTIASIADDYKLSLNINGITYTGTLEALDKLEKFTLRSNGMCATYYGEDALAEKTIDSTIEVGANVTGIMIFTFHNLDNDVLKNEEYLDITLNSEMLMAIFILYQLDVCPKIHRLFIYQEYGKI